MTTALASTMEPTAGAMVRTGLSSTEITVQAERQSIALAAQAKASVEAMFTLAMHRPRDFFQVRERILSACKRPRFAEAALYSKPVGGKDVIGFTIRFAEEAARAMGNVLPATAIIHDDKHQRILRVTATDLEVNLTYYKDVALTKAVEWSKVKAGQVVIAQRANSSGGTTFIVEATEDEFQVKESAAVSKALRELLLRLVPSGIKEDARDQIDSTMNDPKQDLAAVRKRTADKFNELGVSAGQLAEYIGKPLAEAGAEELKEIRLVGAAMSEGHTTWAEAFAAKRGDAKDEAETEKKTRAEELKEKLSKGKASKTAEESKDKPSTKFSSNAESIIAQANAATSATGVSQARKNLNTYSSTMEADEIEAVEAAIAEAERRLTT